MHIQKYPCAYMRGGTSKALVFHKKDLPEDESRWEALFLRAMGTPDPKQIDGMGGAVSSTSKIAVVSPSGRADADVDYTFFQVGVGQPSVSHNVNCGNISSCIGPFAIEEGLVAPVSPATTVRIYNTNTGKIIHARVPVADGRAAVYGDASIPGVPGQGAPIEMRFFQPGGAVTGRLFPSGQLQNRFILPDGRDIWGTLADAGTAAVFVCAEDFGRSGAEGMELGEDRALLRQLEAVRGQAAVLCNLAKRWQDAQVCSPATPDIVMLSSPKSYERLGGGQILAKEMDLCARCFCLGMLHRAFPVTTAIALGAAAFSPGTIAHELVGQPALGQALRIGHMSGVFSVGIEMQGAQVRCASLIRTARRIMDGQVYIPQEEARISCKG